MTSLAGISGSLFPSRYLATVSWDEHLPHAADSIEMRRRKLAAWWRHVERECGPATGLHGLFDLVAMPLAAMLGFRARQVRFERTRVEACLQSPPGGAVVGLVVLPWAASPSMLWRDLVTVAGRFGADWGLLVAPPFVSVVEARAAAVRRSVDFTFPDVLAPESFLPFWALTHASAFETPSRRLEDLLQRAASFQDRVRNDLQQGVVLALRSIGSAVTPVGRQSAPGASFDEALTLVYRLLFLLFVESRQLVPRDHPIYAAAYAVTTLCRTALQDAARPTGMWESVAAITRLSRMGCRADDLIVRPFNGRLFARSSAPSLERGRPAGGMTRASAARDAAIGDALVSLGTRPGPGGREEISYTDLGVEQLGAVYERVLDLDPEAVVSPERGAADPCRRQARAHSDRRKQTGTFYTPQSVAEFVVRRTLGPLVRGASADAILALRVVDPAMGSGAFLVAACRYLAAAYEHALLEEGRLVEADLDQDARADIRRRVAEHCLAGIDLNPVAVQLARLSLWLTALARGKPLNFLDHRLRTGNSLVGISPDDLWRRPGRGRTSRDSPSLFEAARLEDSLRRIARPLAELISTRDDSVDAVHAKSAVWSRLSGARSPLDPWRVACSLWCARWFWSSREQATTAAARPPADAELAAAIDAVLRSDSTLGRAQVESWISTARGLASALGMFHWPLEFADVFYDRAGQPRARPGFDAVIGNPPWEMLRDESGGRAPDPTAGGALDGRGRRQNLVRFIRESGQYPSCDRGHVNLYQPFLERALSLVRLGGRIGFVVPWGLATDDGTAALRRRLFEQGTVDTIAGFDNAAALFPIHRGLRFMVIVAQPGGEPRETRARFGLRTTAEVDTLPDVDDAGEASAFPIRLSRQTLAAVGGAACRIPDVRHAEDLAWLERLTRTCPALGDPRGWAIRFGRELNATDDRHHFGSSGMPVLEGKHLTPFVADIAGPAVRLSEARAARLLPDGRFRRPRLGYRDVSGVTNRSSLIAAVLPANVVSTHTIFCLRSAVSEVQQHFLCGLFNSYVLNAVVRMLMGGHVTTSLVEHLPAPPWRDSSLERRIAALAEQLSHPATAPAAVQSARAAEASLQAAVAELYEIDASTFARLVDGFPLVEIETRALALKAFRA